jgi:signal transduction histidine kinase
MELTLPDSSLVVHGDSARLVQLFGNLISNASKFTPTGGRIEVTARSDGPFVVASIKDTGSGMAADKLLCIFEPFTQLETSTLRSHTGLGIGLALVKQLVEMHGGAIEARSDGPGHGSEFVLRLPLHQRSTQVS